jgi:putative DNA primase/helicase
MLAEKVTGKSFRELADLVRQNVGVAPQVERPKIDEVAQQNAIRSLWASSWQPSQLSPVGIYQTIRLGRPWASKSIREVSYGGLPAMLAKIDRVDGKGVNLHLTHLTEDGQKADVEPGKRVMPGKLPDGCAIRLWPAAERMGVAEGIESAMSAAILFKMPVWATINGTMMAKWVPPEEAKEIWIFGDNDGNYTGQAKAYALAHRLSVQFGRLVEVRIPEGVGEDWNDVLKSGRGPY